MNEPVPHGCRRRSPGRWAVSACLALVAVACGPVHRSPERPPVPASGPDVAPPEDDPVPVVLHEVRAGETAWRIARTYGVSLERLAAVNGLEDPTRIAVGDLLTVPGARRPIDVPVHPAPPPPYGALDTSTERPDRGDATLDWPVDRVRIVSGFGAPRGRRRHLGIDLDGNRGDPIRAAADGRVVYAGSGMRGYGRVVIVEHDESLTTLYAHASELEVRQGDPVRRGQVIARIGSTGNASGTHCHFEVRRAGAPVDPGTYLFPSLASRDP